VVYGLLKAGAGRVHLFARRQEQAFTFLSNFAHISEVDRLLAHSWEDLPGTVNKPVDSPLIVNTTPLGMSPVVEGSPWPADLAFPRGAFVYDLVYNPAETRLLRQAREVGCQGANGLGMLLWQGVQAFELWTGKTPDVGLMAAALRP
jgi:shikimate dehydrogenase